jgi:butyrate response factor 1
LCKNFSELGYCNYGAKCRFAHGKHELISTLCQQKQHKDRKCKGFWKNGICPYGIRCQFGHMETDWTLNSILIAERAIIEKDSVPTQSKLLKLL